MAIKIEGKITGYEVASKKDNIELDLSLIHI